MKNWHLPKSNWASSIQGPGGSPSYFTFSGMDETSQPCKFFLGTCIKGEDPGCPQGVQVVPAHNKEELHSNLPPKFLPLGKRLQTPPGMRRPYPGGRARWGRGQKREWRQGEVSSGAKEAPKVWGLAGWEEARIRSKVRVLGWGQANRVGPGDPAGGRTWQQVCTEHHFMSQI